MVCFLSITFNGIAQDSTDKETRGRIWFSVGGGESTYQERDKPLDIVGFPVNEAQINYWRNKTLYSIGARSGKGFRSYYALLGKMILSKGNWLRVYGSGGLGIATEESDSQMAIPAQLELQFVSLKYISFGLNLNVSLNTFNGAVVGASFLYLNIGILR